MSGPVDWDALVIGPLEAVFGEAIIYTPAGGLPINGLIGVYDEQYLSLSPLDMQEQIGISSNISTTMPVIGMQLSSFPAGIYPAQGDGLVVLSNGASYLVKEVRPDGHGWAKLLLNNA